MIIILCTVSAYCTLHPLKNWYSVCELHLLHSAWPDLHLRKTKGVVLTSPGGPDNTAWWRGRSLVLHLCNTGLSEGCGNISYATKSTGLVVVFNQYLPDGEVELQSLISLQETAGWLAGSLLCS